MPRESVAGDGSDVTWEKMRFPSGLGLTLQVGFVALGCLPLIFNLCSLGFGGYTSEIPTVKLMAIHQLDRRFNDSWTGSRGSPRNQTDASILVRPEIQRWSNRSPSVLRVTFSSAKSFRFWMFLPFNPL
uniref:Uncharacterized protein n=1 Tax=Oryza meridionalis TaxID=40149 RepID=A0A0E0E2G0_9ORYZ